MKTILTILTTLLLIATTNAQAKMSEGDWVNKTCKGDIEYTLEDKTRVDCLTDSEAQEYDWASGKVYECIGQALYYSAMTGKQPACVLIQKNDNYQKYVNRAAKIIESWGLPIDLHLIKVDENGNYEGNIKYHLNHNRKKVGDWVY